MTEPGNIDIFNRPSIPNPRHPGQMSSVQSVSRNFDGVETLLPSVFDGQVFNPDDAEQMKMIVDRYRKTGEHLGKFSSPELATEYGHVLHSQQEAMGKGGWGGAFLGRK